MNKLFWKEVRAILYKDLLVEWRQKYAIGGLLLYVFAACFVSGFILHNKITPVVWNAIFWVLQLFISLNAVARSFMNETDGQIYYLYTLISPMALVSGRLMYNTILMSFVSTISMIIYGLFLGFPVIRTDLYILYVFVGGGTLGATLTLLSAIASRSNNRLTLMAVISLPVLIPQLSLLIKLTNGAVFDSSTLTDLGNLLALTLIAVGTTLLLFTFLWHD
jgi:heme exporter protein B